MKIALGVEYNGHEFFGWQAQENLPTIQGHLEHALSQIAAEPIQIFCAGRTDAGVHATGQVVHFETTAIRDVRAWTLGVNSYLPSSISVSWAQKVNEDFHARFSAIARRYCYVIHNHTLRSALLAARATWFYRQLDAQRMHEAGQYLVGEHDFTSLRSSQCEAKSPMRCIQELNIKRQGDFVVMEIQANAFLHHMVRNIAGLLMQVGCGLKPINSVAEILAAKDRRLAGATASAHGLYLNKVIYPNKYQIPVNRNSLLFL